MTSGVYTFEKTPQPGHRFANFNNWVSDIAFEPTPVDLIVYEKPLGRWAKSQAQVDLSIGFKTRLEELAYRHAIRLEAVPIGTLKKATTGSGNASKEEMIAAINTLTGRGLTAKDHDEADAIALLRYAQKWDRHLTDSIYTSWKTEKGDPF